MEQVACPYCHATLPKVPKRTTTCPSCKQSIYVRTKQSLFASQYLTDDQAEVIDHLIAVEWLGITPAIYLSEKAALSKRFGQRASDGDTLWSIYSQLKLKFAKAGDFNAIAMIYSIMATHLTTRGKDSTQLQVEAQRTQLMLIKKSLEAPYLPYRRAYVIIETSVAECDECKTLQGKRFSVDEALEKMPLPHKRCSLDMYKNGQSYCICSYRADYISKYK